MKVNIFRSAIPVNRQAGITLVEVMVTVLILAVGSLGIASLQLAGLKYSSGSYARTQITILSDDMANRLKSNRIFALNQNPDGNFGDSPYVLPDLTGAQPVGRNCITEQCSEAEFAAYDLATWTNEIARTIPSGRGQLLVVDNVGPDGLTDRQFQIQIEWRQVASSTNPDEVDGAGIDDDEIKNITYRVSL